jgi:hypothetical protein
VDRHEVVTEMDPTLFVTIQLITLGITNGVLNDLNFEYGGSTLEY